MWTVTVAVRNSTFIWTGQALILFGWNILIGHVETFEYYFRWNWENYAQTSIRMDYGRNDVSYLDDVYIGGNRLSGYLDGRNNFVEYTGR